MKAQGTPGGLARAYASGGRQPGRDPSGPADARGDDVGDAEDKVTINSPETEKALNFAKALYARCVVLWNYVFNK